jgi:hypothetical protein
MGRFEIRAKPPDVHRDIAQLWQPNHTGRLGIFCGCRFFDACLKAVIPKGATIDLESLRRDRDQLLAEALAEVRAGAPWHLTSEEIRREQAEQVEDRRSVDVWEEKVLSYLRAHEPRLRQARGPDRGVSLSEVLESALSLPTEKWGQGEQNRANRILRALGWERKNPRLPGVDTATGKQKREWRWFPPDLPTPDPPPGSGTNQGGGGSGTTNPEPKKADGTSGTSGTSSPPHVRACAEVFSTDSSPVPHCQEEETAPLFSSSSDPTGTTGTTGTKREKQEGSDRYRSADPPSQIGTTGTKAWADAFSEAMAAGYSEEEAAQLADLEAAPPTPQPPGALA